LWLDTSQTKFRPERTAEATNLPSSLQDANRLFHPNQPLRSWVISCRRPATAHAGLVSFHRQKIIQNNLSIFCTGGDELLVSRTRHFTVFKGFPFVFNAFAGSAGVVAAGKTIVSAVKTSQWTAKTTPASAGEVVAAGAGTFSTAKTTRAAAETISSAVAKVVAAFATSPRTVRTISCALKIILTTSPVSSPPGRGLCCARFHFPDCPSHQSIRSKSMNK